MSRAPALFALLAAAACAPPPAAPASASPPPSPALPAPTVAPSEPGPPPAAPGALGARRVDRTSRPTMVWASVTGAAGYDVEIAPCSAAPCRFAEGVVRARAKDSRFVVPRAGLPAGRLGFRVRACDAASRCSTWSEPLALAGAGARPAFDFNGDGFADIAVAPKLPPATARGTPAIPRAVIEDLRRLRVYYGSPGGPPKNATLLAAPDARACVPGVCCTVLGDALAAGDLNGDGFADSAVAGDTFCPDAPGSVLVYYGSPSGLPDAPSRVLPGPAHAGFGQALAVGDLDGDGFADLVVGAPRDEANGARSGAVYVYRGSAEGVAATPARLTGPKADAHFGASVAALGDTDGDGTLELAVGAVDWHWGSHDAGAVYLFRGGDLAPLAGPLTDDAGGRGARFGFVVLGADVNGDGLADLLVGAALEYATVFDAPPGATRPAVSTFLGARGGLPRAPSRRHAFSRANWNRLAAAGDVDGDGFEDFVVSRPFLQSANKAYYLGDVQLYLGGPDGPPEAPSQTIPGGDKARRTACSNVNGTVGFGQRIAGVGDVNGDGFDDVAVICTRTDRTLVFMGRKGGLAEAPGAELDVEGVMLGGVE